MSGITLSTLRSRLNTNLQESQTSGYWANSEKTNYINMAYIVAAGDILWKQASTTFTLRQNKTFYLNPSDMLLPLRIRDTSNAGGTTTHIIPPGLVVELEIEVPAWRVVAATAPLKIIFRSVDYTQVWPPPNAQYAGTNLTVEYVPVPATLTNDSDLFDGPLACAEAVLELASVFALEKYDIEKAFKRYNDHYLPRMQSCRSDFDRDSIFQTLKWRVAGRFEKSHHSVGFRRLFPFGIHY